MARPVYPLLIRNPMSSLLRVTIDIGKIEPAHDFLRNDVRLTSIAFTLDAESLGDLETIELFSTGEADDLIASRRGGSARPQRSPRCGSATLCDPAPAITFYTNLLLLPGKNVFWLSAS